MASGEKPCALGVLRGDPPGLWMSGAPHHRIRGRLAPGGTRFPLCCCTRNSDTNENSPRSHAGASPDHIVAQRRLLGGTRRWKVIAQLTL